MVGPELTERLERFEAFLAQDPGNRGLINEVVDLCITVGHRDRARALIADALARFPDDAALRFRQATVDLAAGRSREAIATLAALRADGIDNASVRYNVAYAFMLERRFDEARELLETLVEGENSLAQASLLLARVWHHLGDLNQALRYATRYTDEDGTCAEGAGVRALIHLDRSEYEEAKVRAEHALANDPHNLEARIVLGTLMLEDEDARAAGLHFADALEHFPTSGRAWSGKGLVEMRARDPEAAISSLKQAVLYMPNHIGTWHALAWCQIVLGEIDAARASFDAAMAVDHNFAETHGGLAVVMILQGRQEEAKPVIQKTLRLDKASFAGRFAQTLLAEQSGDPANVRQLMADIMHSQIGSKGERLQDILARTMRNT